MFQFQYDKLSCLAWRRFLPLLFFFLWVLGVPSFLCSTVLMEVYWLVESLSFFHNIFKKLGLSIAF